MIDFNRFVAGYYDRFMAALRALDQRGPERDSRACCSAA